MRPSISLYKKFLLAKQKSPKLVVASLVAGVTIVVGACRITQSAQSSDPQAASNWNLNPIRSLATMAGADVDSEPALKLTITDPKKSSGVLPVAELVESSCSGGPLGLSTKQVWRLKFTSAFGPHVANLTINANSNGEGPATATIGSRELSFKTFQGMDTEGLRAACAAVKDDKETLAVNNPAQVEMIKQWLTRIAPDCDMEPNQAGWSCALPTIDSGLAQSELDGIHRTMISRWNRQPYLISRRLAVTRSLAQAVREPGADERLNTLCRVIGFALPAELPLAMASNSWQDHVCKTPSTNRVQIARIGLNKALDEIDFLRKLFEQNSKLGTLIVRIPRVNVPTRDVWISLKPAVEESTNVKPHHACWHPMFKDQDDFMNAARQLELLSETDGSSCDSVVVATTAASNAVAKEDKARGVKPLDATRYLAESITSETEFVITNGQSKLLRLPMGTYTYIVRPHSEALSELETDPNITPSTGTIVWTKQRPSVMIKQW